MARLFRNAAFAYTCVGGLCGLMWSQQAFADNCDNLDKNKAWIESFNHLNEAYDKGDYDAALQYSRDLEAICELSPILNYTIAYIHKNKGDNEKYLFYLQKSTQNTERFMVDKNLLDRIWSDKYIAAHPDAAPENIKNLNDRLESATAEIDRLKSTTEKLESSTSLKNEILERQMADYKTTLWIGAGIGIGGLVLGGVGAALIATTDPVKFNKEAELPARYKETPLHVLGWSLVGVGAGLTITGAVLGGIYGYKYGRAKDSVTYSFNLAPTNASLTIQF